MLLHIQVIPNAKHEKREEQNDLSGKIIYKAWLTVPPVDGKANDALIKLLSKKFKTPKSRIKILRGQTSRLKVAEIQTS